MDRSSEATALLAAMDAELAANAAAAGVSLEWSQAERQQLALLASTVDRRVELEGLYGALEADDVKTRLKLSAELRLIAGLEARLLRGISTEPPRVKDPKAQHAARVRWAKEGVS